MPIRSSKRGVFLYSAEELAALVGRTARAVRKATNRPGVYFEVYKISRPGSRGSKRTKFVDITTTMYAVDPGLVTDGTCSKVPSVGHSRNPLTEPRGRGSVSASDPSGSSKGDGSREGGAFGDGTGAATLAANFEGARERLELLRPVLSLPKRDRAAAVQNLATAEGVSPRTVYRWISSFEAEGIKALSRDGRADRGQARIPAYTYDLIVSALISNPPRTATSMIHRTLRRAAPDAMTYRRGNADTEVSVTTIRRIRKDLLADPRTRLLFFDVDRRREYLRTYSGQVVAAHANDLWQMDMTRCDTMVIDPESGRTFRPRVHAIIDVYSGCIPGIVFSTEENQVQTDLAILRAVLPKSGPYAEKYPVFGVPGRLYLDNGKTYTSEQAHRVLGGLGVEVVHSLPRVSHTRGRIERFFGTLHSFERSLPGYVGKDARDRAAREIKRLTRNTLAWLEHGRDPGEGERLLTIAEYQNFVLAWLVAEYHAWPVHGKTRLEHFVETAPARSQAILDRAELLLLFAERTSRVVDPSGTIRLDNQRWSVPDGSLIKFQGKKLLVLRDQFTLGEDRRLVVWKDRHGRLEVIGEATPAPSVADSLEAGELRRASKAQAQRALRDAKRQARDLTNPELRVSKQLLKEVEVVLESSTPPTARGRVAAVNPPDPREALDPEDPLVKHLQDPFANGVVPEDPVERLRWLRERRKREDA